MAGFQGLSGGLSGIVVFFLFFFFWGFFGLRTGHSACLGALRCEIVGQAEVLVMAAWRACRCIAVVESRAVLGALAGIAIGVVGLGRVACQCCLGSLSVSQWLLVRVATEVLVGHCNGYLSARQ